MLPEGKALANEQSNNTLYNVTYSICCPEYFNLSSNPATSFISLFTLLMRGLNEDNTTGLCFKMAGGHSFKACIA